MIVGLEVTSSRSRSYHHLKHVIVVVSDGGSRSRGCIHLVVIITFTAWDITQFRLLRDEKEAALVERKNNHLEDVIVVVSDGGGRSGDNN